jgi:hypothetical protein
MMLNNLPVTAVDACGRWEVKENNKGEFNT